MVLRSSEGEVVLGRCRAVNLCPYCARLAAVENAEVLALDALNGTAPALYGVLTTSSTDRTPRSFYEARRKVGKALRRRWPDCEWAVQVEFTTGEAEGSGGHRRQHWNWLLKGIPVADCEAALAVMVKVWCPRTAASSAGQYLAPVAELGGLMRYLSLHFSKPAQAPPIGWRGHRFLHSRGYFPQSMPAVRAEARHSLRFKRELWKAEQRGVDVHDAELQAREAMARAKATTWTFARLPGASHWVAAGDADAVRAGALAARGERDALDQDLAVVDELVALEQRCFAELRACRWAAV
jgi:hypothetical protein